MPVTRAMSHLAMEEPCCCCLDPLAELGPDLLHAVLAHLPLSDLQSASQVSRGWREAANDDRLWRALCEEAWAPLRYVPAGRPGDSPWRRRYTAAQRDLQRTAITAEELCTFRWKFHFKAEAGEFWATLDPFWTGREQLERLFLPDGSTVPGNPKAWAALHAVVGVHNFGWRICRSRAGVRGCFVRIHNFPSLALSRPPGGGWRMENVWVVYEAVLPPGGPYCRGITPGQPPHLAA